MQIIKNDLAEIYKVELTVMDGSFSSGGVGEREICASQSFAKRMGDYYVLARAIFCINVRDSVISRLFRARKTDATKSTYSCARSKKWQRKSARNLRRMGLTRDVRASSLRPDER